MTEKQKRDYNRMLKTLKRIAIFYQGVAELQQNAERDYGLEYIDVLEMAYENIQEEAKQAMCNVPEVK